MKLARIMLASLLCVSLPLEAIAAPHVIARLGSAPLLGQLSSTPRLQAEVGRQRRTFEAAGALLGLTPKEFMQVEARIEAKQLTYVTIPRHLDAMTGSRNGQVFVVRDVVIPAQSKGWEIDLQENHQTLAVFIPARCGNVSLLRRPMPLLAQTKPVTRPVTRVLAESTSPPAPQPVPTAVAAAPAVVMPAPSEPTPAPFTTLAVSSPTTHRFNWWPLLLIPIIGFIAGGGHSGFNSPPVTAGGPPPGGGGGLPPPVPTPSPVIGCTPPPPH